MVAARSGVRSPRRVSSPRARDVVVRQGGERTTVRAASELVGALRAQTGDSLRLAVTSTRSGAGGSATRWARGSEATIAREPGVAVTVLSKHPRLVELALGGAILGAVAVVIWFVRGLSSS